MKCFKILRCSSFCVSEFHSKIDPNGTNVTVSLDTILWKVFPETIIGVYLYSEAYN